MKAGKVNVFIGGQWGSEGKGVFVRHVVDEYQVHVRTGGSNAGHSFLHDGRTWKTQVVPIGWTNPDALLVIGAGAVVDVTVLEAEIREIEDNGYSLYGRIFIDQNAYLHLPQHTRAEGGVNGLLGKNIGSTGKGVGAARSERLNRVPPAEPYLAKHLLTVAHDYQLVDYTCNICDTVAMLDKLNRSGQNILLEGTQGSALSLFFGEYPYVTSADTNAAQFVADAGLSPFVVTDVTAVFRTFPIRVGGNSGGLPNEITWDELSTELGRSVTEQTTVTKKTRRIGRWSDEVFNRTIQINRPNHIALSFVDYFAPMDEGIDDYDKLSSKTQNFVARIESMAHGTPVSFLGTGKGEDTPFTVIDRRVKA